MLDKTGGAVQTRPSVCAMGERRENATWQLVITFVLAAAAGQFFHVAEHIVSTISIH